MLVLQLTRHADSSSSLQSSYGLVVLDDTHEDGYFVSFQAPTDLLDESHAPGNVGRIGAWICEAVLEERADGQDAPATCLGNALEYGDEVVLRFEADARLGLPGHEAPWAHMGLMEEHADLKEAFESEKSLKDALPEVPSAPRPKF